MQTLTQVVKACSDFLWGVPMLVMLFGTHLFLTVRLHFVQRHTFKAIRLSVTPDKGSEGEVSQFGALVTNGQEELASLAYLITMEFIAANGPHIQAAGGYYHARAAELVKKHPGVCTGVEGDAHMTALCFARVDDAVDFCARMNRDFCVDISAQTYKPNCPPVALTKLPLIVTESMADRLLALFGAALAQTAGREGRA